MRYTPTQPLALAHVMTVGVLCLSSLLAVSPARAQSCDGWRLVAPGSTGGHRMVYDQARGESFFFGGDSSNEYSQNTWRWDGASWQLASSTGPAGRTGFGMAYDSARNVTVLFGGYGGDYYGDTWEWNGATWTLRATTGPSRRSQFAMAYDSARGVCVLYGGYDPVTQNSSGQTWEWNGTVWTIRSNVGPPALQGAEMAYDAARGVCVLFGGWNQFTGSQMRQTWEWNGVAWTQVGLVGPTPLIRLGHRMVYDSSSGVTVLFGGARPTGGSDSDETWEWDGSFWTLVDSATPSARASTAMAYDDVRDAIVLFSGSVTPGPAQYDTWERVDGVWSLKKGTTIGVRYGHAMAYDSTRGAAVLFGGRTSNTLLNDTWEWDGSDWVLKSTTGPSPRFHHRMAYDSARGVTVLFGGAVDYATLALSGETWEWDGTTWTLRSTTGPSPRMSHGFAYDAARGVTVLFGGNKNARDNETWEWNGTTWTQRIVVSPSARYRHAMTYDSSRNRVVMFGGWDGSPDNETWEFNGAAWTRVATTGPAARENHAVAYDAAAGVTVLTGGDVVGDSIAAGETWEWDGASWANRTVAAQNTQLQRRHHAMAFDTARGTTVMFGGSDPYDSADTWERTNGAPVVSVSGPSSVGAGLEVTLTANACGSRMTYEWRKDGVPLSNGVTTGGSFISGATTPMLTIANVQFDDEADYDVVVTNQIAPTTSAAFALDVRTPIPGDLNDDGDVDLSDLATLLADFGCGFPSETCVGDVDGDFDTDLSDLATLLANFGSTAP